MHSVADWQTLIGRAASAITQREASSEKLDGLLFFGNPHDTVPRALLLDPNLGAVDILGWQMIRLMSGNDRTTSFPTYDQLQPLLRSSPGTAASRGTVARVIAILRLTRWLSLCHRARNTDNGRVIGNVYALHDEPLNVDEALMLDPNYLEFLQHCLTHKNRAVQEVAKQVFEDIQQGGGQRSRFDQRALRFIEMTKRSRSSQTAQPQLTHKTRSENSVNAPVRSENSARELSKNPSSQSELRTVLELSSQRELSKNDPNSLISDLVRSENSSTVQSTCTYKNTSTVRNTWENSESLLWHPELNASPVDQRNLSSTLAKLDQDTAQRVLDETAGRVIAGKARNPIALLRSLLNSALKNEFKVTHYAQSIRQPLIKPERPPTLPASPTPMASPSQPQSQPRRSGPPIMSEEAKALRAEVLRIAGVKRP